VLTAIRLGSQTTALRPDSTMQIRAVTLPSGEADSSTLGNLHLPLDDRTNAPYAASTDRLFSFDNGYRLQQHFKNVTPAAGRFFTYDSLGQLKTGSDKHWTSALPGNCLNLVFGYTCQASGSGWTTDNAISYSYDLAGNRTSQGGTYGAANRITAFNGCTYATDTDGNLTSRTCAGNPALSATFTWTAEGLLKTVTNQGTTTTFQYDGAGRLVRRDVAGSAQGHYLWDGDNLLAELNAAGTTKLLEYAYYPGLDQVQALIQGTTPYFAHRDGLGNVIALTDAAKTVQRTYTYDDWGNTSGGTDTHGFSNLDRARWKGALWTSSAGGDLYYMRSRWYEPYSGRFLSEDPLGLAGGLNLYAYAGDDPVNGADPTGLQDCEDGPKSSAHPLPCMLVQGYSEEELAIQAIIRSGCFLKASWFQCPHWGVQGHQVSPDALWEHFAAQMSLRGGWAGQGGRSVPPLPEAPQTGPQRQLAPAAHEAVCSRNAMLADARAGAVAGQKKGLFFGPAVGAFFGAGGGSLVGGVVGSVLAAPTVIGIPAGAVGGFIGGGIEGSFYGALVGAVLGQPVGYGLGFTGSLVSSFFSRCT
jgi:RHS repeat-associated protein